MDMNQFFELVKDPALYEKKLAEINAAEKAALDAIKAKAKVDEIDKLKAEAETLVANAKAQAQTILDGAAKEAKILVDNAKQALARGEDAKKKAAEEYDQYKKATDLAKADWLLAQKQKEDNEKRLRGIVQREIELADKDQALQARIAKLNAALQ